MENLKKMEQVFFKYDRIKKQLKKEMRERKLCEERLSKAKRKANKAVVSYNELKLELKHLSVDLKMEQSKVQMVTRKLERQLQISAV